MDLLPYESTYPRWRDDSKGKELPPLIPKKVLETHLISDAGHFTDSAKRGRSMIESWRHGLSHRSISEQDLPLERTSTRYKPIVQ